MAVAVAVAVAVIGACAAAGAALLVRGRVGGRAGPADIAEGEEDVAVVGVGVCKAQHWVRRRRGRSNGWGG